MVVELKQWCRQNPRRGDMVDCLLREPKQRPRTGITTLTLAPESWTSDKICRCAGVVARGLWGLFEIAVTVKGLLLFVAFEFLSFVCITFSSNVIALWHKSRLGIWFATVQIICVILFPLLTISNEILKSRLNNMVWSLRLFITTFHLIFVFGRRYFALLFTYVPSSTSKIEMC